VREGEEEERQEALSAPWVPKRPPGLRSGGRFAKSGPIKATALAASLCLALAALAQAEVSQEGNLRVSFEGKIAPHKLPRIGMAPVSVSLSGDIKTTDASTPPQLRKITLAINRNGRFDNKGLPICHFHQVQPASTQEAREACPRALVGSGSFKANVALPDQSPFPSNGQILAFNGKLHQKPVIFTHIYGTEPLPTSFTLPFELRRRSKGTYSTILSANLPRVAAQWGYISGVSLKLQRRFHYKGEPRSYISAGCPAPRGFPGATFTFAKASFGFEGGKTISSTMTRSCGVRG
jgi:hypothetical protein